MLEGVSEDTDHGWFPGLLYEEHSKRQVGMWQLFLTVMLGCDKEGKLTIVCY